jgi:hypothetical protein
MPSWYAISDVIFDTIDSYGSSCVLSNHQKDITQSRTEDGILDDSSALVNGRDDRAEHRLQELSQRHEKVLHATGGKLALHKCMWVMLEWAWSQGEPELVQYPETGEGELIDDTIAKLEVTQSEDDSQQQIRRINSNAAYRTLGIYISASGQMEKQTSIIQYNIDTWVKRINYSTLGNNEIKIAYPLACSTITIPMLRKVIRPALKILMNSYGLRKSFPRAVVFGGPKYFGLELDDLAIAQGSTQIRYYMGHTNMCDRTGKLLRISKDNLELVIGTGRCLLEYPTDIPKYMTNSTWITSLCGFLQLSQCKILTRGERVLKKQRENDKFIVNDARKKNLNIRLIQQCRLYL